MAEEITTSESTTSKSSGNVKITIEEYNDLMSRANRPQTVVYNRIEKTPEMAANDKVVIGNVFLIAGVAQVAVGVYLRLKGLTELKAL